MALEVDATYADGVLKLDRPLPLNENERLTVRIISKTTRAQESYGRVQWTGDPETLRKIAEDDDLLEA